MRQVERDRDYVNNCADLGIVLEALGEKVAFIFEEDPRLLAEAHRQYVEVEGAATRGSLHSNEENMAANDSAMEGNSMRKLGFDTYVALLHAGIVKTGE